MSEEGVISPVTAYIGVDYVQTFKPGDVSSWAGTTITAKIYKPGDTSTVHLTITSSDGITIAGDNASFDYQSTGAQHTTLGIGKYHWQMFYVDASSETHVIVRPGSPYEVKDAA